MFATAFLYVLIVVAVSVSVIYNKYTSKLVIAFLVSSTTVAIEKVDAISIADYLQSQKIARVHISDGVFGVDDGM